MPLLKYVIIVLSADDNAEGGTFPLYSLLCRHAKFSLLPNQQAVAREFSCLIDWKVMTLPLTFPYAHNFCKPCLEDAFIRHTFVRERTCHGCRRPLRTQKNVMKWPSCPTNISDFLQNPQEETTTIKAAGNP
ncbi:hypothetical protein GIB67_033501 [Kingdonia uniflora]|uniref:Uncharacterized protein n=1 Tax=Kingdonia uniflora TaxID=39325 RepID=A0A7J7L653_9MAGN|nr:hypothetical protein GIB67_033501 [Kingdonia uniflora]